MHQTFGCVHAWSVEKSIPMFVKYSSFQPWKMLQAVLHNYMIQLSCPDPPMEDQDQADMLMAKADNDEDCIENALKLNVFIMSYAVRSKSSVQQNEPTRLLCVLNTYT